MRGNPALACWRNRGFKAMLAETNRFRTHEFPFYPPEIPQPVQTPVPRFGGPRASRGGFNPACSEKTQWNGVTILPYAIKAATGKDVHTWLIDMDTKVKRADYCWQAARKLRDAGFTPDIIIAHPGWGESLFLKDVWPKAKLGLYTELYHHADYPHL